jgi:putative glutamine amidotransferase
MPRRSKLIIGCTEPSLFTKNVIHTIENFFEANPIKLMQNNKDDLYHWVDQCDGVIISGGCDIHPRTYGFSVMNDMGFNKFDVHRDIREMRIIQRCLERDIPMFGICRGHQMIGVYHKIKFLPDLSESLVCHQPNSQKISHAKEEPMHWVKLTPAAKKDYAAQDSHAAECFNQPKDKQYLWVNSFHHQALVYGKTDARKVKVLGLAPGVTERQQIIEMMTSTRQSQRWLSVQWHPEYDWECNAASKMVLSKFRDMLTK